MNHLTFASATGILAVIVSFFITTITGTTVIMYLIICLIFAIFGLHYDLRKHWREQK